MISPRNIIITLALTAAVLCGCKKSPDEADPTITEVPEPPAEVVEEAPAEVIPEAPPPSIEEPLAPGVLTVTSPAFDDGQPVPLEFTCEGADVNPRIEWTAGPDGTATYALIMDDPDAPSGTWVHWVVWNIPGTNLEDVLPAEASFDTGMHQGVNTAERTGYQGPCPPVNHGEHRYIFTVYALDTTLDLPATTTKADLLAAMDGHILTQGQLMGTYVRTD